MIHALGLILIGLLAATRPSAMLAAAGWTMLAGIFLFCDFLYAYLATGNKLFATPNRRLTAFLSPFRRDGMGKGINLRKPLV